jgi:cytochrome oxidase Cu insertion factor (SCO1/SenC/PrrC family)
MPRLALVLVALAVLAACGGTESVPQGAGRATTAGSPTGQPVDLEGTTLDGARLSLADFRGKPVFVNVWASW